MRYISRDQAWRMICGDDGNVAVIEALPAEHFQEFHLPKAVNVPLDERFEEQIREAAPSKSTPVVVYGVDTECDASRKAAMRMEELGYESVFDYEAGKVDWKLAGLPIER